MAPFITSNAALAALLGAAGAFVAQLIINHFSDEAQKHRLRTAFLAELRNMPNFTSVTNRAALNASQEVYLSNVNQLGMLTDDEVEKIVAFYSDLVHQRQRDLARRVELQTKKFDDSLQFAEYRQTLSESQVKRIEERKNDAIEAIECNYDDWR
ncbi:hypothetical protein ACFQJC_15025 [Haloferax namakaokahaiae]|uniref:Uncharacterized protein n=1 Tax=Haloferax namakaokahaiae TaxID=1748331 RepID=A0ABD5ZHT4_9EURY